MLQYKKVNRGEKDAIQILSALASSIVKEHYDPILGPEQNDYMIQMFQSVPAIEGQLDHGYQYYMVQYDGTNVGFTGFYKRETDLYLSKFYLAKEYRGRGFSREMLHFLVGQANEMGVNYITLNVNKYNSAVYAYEKLGLVRVRDEVNDIGHGYVMDDYVYQYDIQAAQKDRKDQ